MDEIDEVCYTYASVDMSRKTGGENLAKKPPPPKPAKKPPLPKPAQKPPPPKPAQKPPSSVSDTLPDGYIYSEVIKKTK